MKKIKIYVAVGALLSLGGVYYFRRAIRNNVRNMINGSYFTIDELCYSATAKSQGIDITPSAEVRANLQALITNMLDPIRAKYGEPITVSSGYRSERLNTAVGGVKNSQHLTGQAADLVGAHRTDAELAKIFKSAISVGGYDQLILEYGKNGSHWVHVSYDPKRNRREVLLYKNGKYTNIKSNWEKYV